METVTLATLQDFADRLAEVGVNIMDVCVAPGPRLHGGDMGDPLTLVVTTYAKDDKGKRYFDVETQKAATEVRRFFVTSDWHLTAEPCSNASTTTA